jgi:N-acetylornithine carbamoyltransferase
LGRLALVDVHQLQRGITRRLPGLCHLQQRPEPQALAGKILGLLFMNPSLRTLSSFQAGPKSRS